MKEVGIFVLTYNRINLLKEEIVSLRNQTYRDFDIIVVNNASTDGTGEWLSSQDDLITINIAPDNIGPAAAFATGLRYVAEHGYRYCWLMDDDVECSSTALAELVSANQLKEGIGYLCSKVVGVNGVPMNVPVVDNRPSDNGYPSFHDMMDYSMLKVRQCTFVSMFIPTVVIGDVGLPYSAFYNWAVDYEYSMRISEKYPCYFVNRSAVVHKRVIQSNLDINIETDPVRIAYWRSHYRNLIFINFKFGESSRFKVFVNNVITGLVKILTGRGREGSLWIHASLDFLKFKPEVEYIEKQSF